jgi:PTS system mannose-specific IIA component
MNGIVLVAHGTVANALIQCVTHVYGVCPQGIEVCSIDSMDAEARLRVQSAIERALQGREGVLVLTDVYGASPANVVMEFVQPQRVAMLSGMNMPMLLRAITYRNESLEILCEKALEGGVRGMVCVKDQPEKKG